MKLFFSRFLDDLQTQIKTIKWAIPTIAWIYVGVPMGLFFIYFYHDLWHNTQIYWNDSLPLKILYLALLVFISGGNIRSYLLEADLIFLMKHQKKMINLRLCGFFITLCKNILLLFLLMLLTLPILINIYQLSSSRIGVFFVQGFTYKVIILFIRRRIRNPFIQCLLIIVSIVAFSIMGVSLNTKINGILSFMVIGIATIQFIKESHMNKLFIREIELEMKERNKLNQLVFTLSANYIEDAPVIEYPSPFSMSSKPRIFFPDSKRIFKKRSPENVLIEFCLKAFIRNHKFRTTFLKAILVPYYAVFILPVIFQLLFQLELTSWIRLIFYPVMISVLLLFTKKSYWNLVNHPFFQIVTIDQDVKYSAEKRFQAYFILPIAILTSLIWSIF